MTYQLYPRPYQSTNPRAYQRCPITVSTNPFTARLSRLYKEPRLNVDAATRLVVRVHLAEGQHKLSCQRVRSTLAGRKWSQGGGTLRE